MKLIKAGVSLITVLFFAFGMSTPIFALSYKFPWDWGGSWQWTWGWHQCNDDNSRCAVDIATYDEYDSVLAPADGVITQVCYGSITLDMTITHSDGIVMKYLHLDKATVGNNVDVDKSVFQGEYLGVVRKGSFSDWMGSDCNYTSDATQGSTTGHLHWSMPSKTNIVSVEGWTWSAYPTNALTKSGSTTKYVNDFIDSTNTMTITNGTLAPTTNYTITGNQLIYLDSPLTITSTYGNVTITAN